MAGSDQGRDLFTQGIADARNAREFALLDDFAFFFTAFFFATGRFDFPVGRFFALLFFLAIINFLLAVLRLLAVRVSPKKSAVICA